MNTRRRFFLAALALVSAGTFFAGTTRAGGSVGSKIEAQLGVRLGSTPPANARIGSTFEGVVLDPAKLSGKGFAGLKKNDRLLLKIVGPNNEFEIQKSGAPSGRRFKFDPQGGIQPSDAPAARAPVAAPAVKQ